jgi:NAD(P)H-nitrite reductase large subunit
MGADSYKPPIGNVDLDGVFTIREYGDANAIRRYIIAGTRRDAGLIANRGIVVDERLRSSDPDIFVAGNLVEYEGYIWGISLTSIGKVTLEPEEESQYRLIRKLDEKYVLFQGVLVGCILLGSKENLAFVNAHSGKEVSEEQLRLRLW